MDPFFAQSTMAIFCDVVDPITGEGYNRDPRMTAKKAEAYVKSGGFGDTIYVGPEAEFFMFDDVRFNADPYNTGFILDSSELPSNMGSEYETGNLGHRPRTKGGYFRFRRSTAPRTSAPKCCPSWVKWAFRPRSTTTKWPLPSTNSA